MCEESVRWLGPMVAVVEPTWETGAGRQREADASWQDTGGVMAVEADVAGREATQWPAFVLFCWSGEDGHRSQDGDEECESAGEMHAGRF